MTEETIQRPADRAGAMTPTSLRSIAACLLFGLVCMGVLACFRASWLDEYWTLWESDPANGLATAYWTRWIRDVPHPPTFSAFVWSVARWTGPTVEAHRIVVSSLALLLTVPTAWLSRRDGRLPGQIVLFALLVGSNAFFITYFAEHRSYFSGLVVTSCLIATLRQLFLEARAKTMPLRRPLLLWFCLLAAIALNLHYVLTCTVLALLGCACVHQWLFGSRRFAALIAGTATLSLVPLLLNARIAFGLQRLPQVTHYSLTHGAALIAMMTIVGLASNAVLLLPAVAELRRMAADRIGWRRKAVAEGFLLVLIATLGVQVVGLLLIQAISHSLVPRMLFALLAVAAAITAELAARARLATWMVALACLNATAAIVVTMAHELRNPRWEYSVPAIRATLHACPTTQILALSPLEILPRTDPAWQIVGQQEVIRLGYHLIGRRYGFAVHVLPTDGAAPPPDRRCPTLIWLEHNFTRPGLTAQQLYASANLDRSGPPPRLTLMRDGSHFLLRVDPH